MRARPLALLLATAACCGCTAKASSDNPTSTSTQPNLVQAGATVGSAAAAELPNIEADVAYSFGGLVLCLDSPGSVTITSIEIDNPQGGLRVDAFGIRPNPALAKEYFLGAEQRSLSTVPGFDLSQDQIIHGVCSDDRAESVELAIEVQKPTSATGSGQGLTVYYSPNQEREELSVLEIPFSITLCSPADTVGQGC